MREWTRFPAEVKGALLQAVAQAQARTGWTVRRILHHLGVSKARYRDWTRRAATDRLTDRPSVAPSRDGILAEEKRAVIDYALAHPKDGYRRLTWQMIDADVAYRWHRVLRSEWSGHPLRRSWQVRRLRGETGI